jgi:hypothetical protein
MILRLAVRRALQLEAEPEERIQKSQPSQHYHQLPQHQRQHKQQPGSIVKGSTEK